MSDRFGNHIAGFPTRRLYLLSNSSCTFKDVFNEDMSLIFTGSILQANMLGSCAG